MPDTDSELNEPTVAIEGDRVKMVSDPIVTFRVLKVTRCNLREQEERKKSHFMYKGIPDATTVWTCSWDVKLV